MPTMNYTAHLPGVEAQDLWHYIDHFEGEGKALVERQTCEFEKLVTGRAVRVQLT